jgi:RNA polymerase sigma-70 factor (ECF subfamily)
MESTADSDLMDRYAQGDASAFDALFGRYDSRVFAFFLARTRCPDRAADLHQELFLRLHRSRDHFDPTRPLAPWIFALARNVWHDDLRRSHGFVSSGCEAIDDQAADRGFESRLIARQEMSRLLDALTPADRALVVDTAVVGFTYGELASPGRRSMAALKQAGARALRRLRSQFTEDGS